jgi:transposase-like protein
MVEVTSTPACPVCGNNDNVVWLSFTRRRGEIAAERWACVGCNAMFGFEIESSLATKIGTVLATVAMTTMIAAFWRRRHRVPRGTLRAA